MCNLFQLFVLAEVDLQHSVIWMAGVYLMLLMQFLENKVAVELTRAEFAEAQEVCLSLSSDIIFFYSWDMHGSLILFHKIANQLMV